MTILREYQRVKRQELQPGWTNHARRQLIPCLPVNLPKEGTPMLPGKLTGRWQRSDGEYTIEIFALYDDGTANVGY
ncbi:MAG: hypothetical protein U5L72_08545 [Bacteroidales bacterium]|nr:hypothetical protein [Bacteroidales bacterium]